MGARKSTTSNTLAEIIAEAVATALAAHVTGEEPAKTAKTAAAKPAKAAKTGRLSRDAFRALKSSGVVPWGMTQKDAIAAGLLGTESNGEPKVRTRKVAAKPAKKAAASKAKSTKGSSGAANKAHTTSWGKSFSAIARTSGLYVNTSETKRANWESIYHVAVQQDWAGVSALRTEGLEPKAAFEEYQARLVADGHDVEHYSNSAAIRKVRAANSAKFAERISA